MNAMLISEKHSLVWSEVPDPVRGPGEVVVRIQAAALNRADLLQRAGKYPPPPGWPEWPGLECAGTVCEAAPESRWKAGDRVCALLGGGGYAQKVAVPENMVMPLPKNLTMEQGAALPEAFATAYLNLRMEGGMKAGDTVFIQAGASGLGIAAIQLAKIFGAKVLTTVGSEAKAEVVRGLGADIVVNRKTMSLKDVMDENPVDIAMDCAGGQALGDCIEKMAVGGRWILIATLGGEHADIPLRPILKRGLRLIGSTLRGRSPEEKGHILRELERHLFPGLETGTVRPLIHRVFPIAQAEAAMTVLERQENIGKVVLTVS